MSVIKKTAYPRYANNKKIAKEYLRKNYSMNPCEKIFINRHARTNVSRLNLAVQLKVFKNLRYFLPIDDIPREIVKYIRKSLKMDYRVRCSYKRDSDNSIYNHRSKIRQYLNIKKWKSEIPDGKSNKSITYAIKVAHDAASIMNYLPDIINVVISELIKNNYELPKFNTLNRLARHTRHLVNNRIFYSVANNLTLQQKENLNLLTHVDRDSKEKYSRFSRLKIPPKRFSIRRIYESISRYEWLQSLGDFDCCFGDISKSKVEQFAEEAYSLTLDEMKELQPEKMYSLLIALVLRTQYSFKDKFGKAFCIRVSKAYKNSKNQTLELLEANKEKVLSVAELLRTIVGIGEHEKKDYKGLVDEQISSAGGSVEVIKVCDDVIKNYGANKRAFFTSYILKDRAVLYKLLQVMQPKSSSSDFKLEAALNFAQENMNIRSALIECDLDLSFMSQFWKDKVIRIIKEKGEDITYVNRKEFEACIFSYIADGLSSGDLHMVGSIEYSDVRNDLIPIDECIPLIADFCKESGIPDNPKEMVAFLKNNLITVSEKVDNDYAKTNDFSIDENGKVVLHKYEAKQKSEKVLRLESIIKQRMPTNTLLDILVNSQHYADWASEFGTITGNEEKLKDPVAKYILTVFAYGTGLGATQMEKHMRNPVSAKILSRINKKHISLKALDKANAKLINIINKFPLLKAWGSGNRCAVDGTFEDIRDNNMFAEYHIRYGNTGGVAYHHIADNYTAIFSSLIQCGVWEAINIIEGLLNNKSDIQPTIVHADTQGQSLTVFAFAYLFGIDLMPRIRNWKDLIMYRPTAKKKYKNIDSLFCNTDIDWQLISDHWLDFMQIIISISRGKISSLYILNKLNSYNKKNKLFKVFNEIGKVLRTTYLLKFISSKELRQIVTENSNKAESFNSLSDWIRFGVSILVASNNIDDMEKSVKYNSLIANSIVLQNVIDITRIIEELRTEGEKITKEDISYLSPYLREHLKRFGEFILDLSRVPRNIGLLKQHSLF